MNTDRRSFDSNPAQAPTPTPIGPDPVDPDPRRLFLAEPGWNVALKIGSERVFCYQMAPGQDYYHRLLDGEVFLFHGDERLCLACAERRGLLTYRPRGLRQPVFNPELDLTDAEPGPGFDLKPPTDLGPQ